MAIPKEFHRVYDLMCDLREKYSGERFTDGHAIEVIRKLDEIDATPREREFALFMMVGAVK